LYEMFRKNFKDILAGNYTAAKQELNPKIYYKRDLENAKDLTRYIKAFHFPGKESAFYINSSGKKIYIEYR